MKTVKIDFHRAGRVAYQHIDKAPTELNVFGLIGMARIDHAGKCLVRSAQEHDDLYIVIETGIAGLAALIWLNASILRATARSAQRGSFFGAWMLCFWSGETVQMLSGDLLTYWRVLPVYFFVLALAIRE